jgi:hypothetical protein
LDFYFVVLDFCFVSGFCFVFLDFYFVAVFFVEVDFGKAFVYL